MYIEIMLGLLAVVVLSTLVVLGLSTLVDLYRALLGRLAGLRADGTLLPLLSRFAAVLTMALLLTLLLGPILQL